MIVHKHKTVGQVIKQLLITVLIMVLLFVIAGAVYVYITGKDAASTLPPPPPVAEVKQPFSEPTMPGPNAPNGASVQYISTPVRPGENSTINIHTGPDSACTIVVAYNNILSKDAGLAPKTANKYGTVSWTWTVSKDAAIGKWPVKVTCERNKKTAYVEGYLEVIR